MEEDEAKGAGAAAARKQEERRTALSVYCENIREAGMLVAVFASLDALFSPVRVSNWVVAWIAVGLGMLYVGVRYDPEVGK